MLLDSIEPHLKKHHLVEMDRHGARQGGTHTPTTKKTPANTAAGIVWRTANKGPVIVPMSPRPIRKCVTRCSTTAVAVTMGRRISVYSPSDVEMILRLVLYTVKESVWTGAYEDSAFFSRTNNG